MTPSAAPPITVWIVDTSPFVGLAKVGCLDLLTAPARQIWIADIVAREVLAGQGSDLAQIALQYDWKTQAKAGFIRRVAPPTPATLAALHLDAGEAAVLSLALSCPGSIAVMDDREGRAAAKTLGIPAVGTVGVLLAAKQEGRLAQIAPILRRRQAVGLFLPKEELLTTLLASLGEKWP